MEEVEEVEEVEQVVEVEEVSVRPRLRVEIAMEKAEVMLFSRHDRPAAIQTQRARPIQRVRSLWSKVVAARLD